MTNNLPHPTIQIRNIPMFFFLLLALLPTLSFSKSSEHLAFKLDPTKSFSQKSPVSMIITSCGLRASVEKTIKSFFYFNTYPINHLYIVHCGSHDGIKDDLALMFGEHSYEGFVDVIDITKTKNKGKGLVGALLEVYSRIGTKFVFQTQGHWLMTKGFGLIQKSMEILTSSLPSSQKISQITYTYPYTRISSILSPLEWTKSGISYTKIQPLDPSTYPNFLTSPSFFQFETIYYTLKAANMRIICESEPLCKGLGVHQWDQCCFMVFGRLGFGFGWRQVWLQDGTGLPYFQIFQ